MVVKEKKSKCRALRIFNIEVNAFMVHLDIIIVNWNAGGQLRSCIKSIEEADKNGFELGRVAIVDNASSDGSTNDLDELNLPLAVIKNSENRGFGAACNQGAIGSKADYLLFLNPDTLLYKDSLSIPLVFIEQQCNQDVGIVGIQLVDEHGCINRHCARFPSLGIYLAQAIGLNSLPGFRHLKTHMSDWAHDSTKTVDHVIGAFYLIRRPLFEALGGFDERFFVYLEDLDLSRRSRLSGWRSVYLAEAQAFHAAGGTSRQVKAHRLFYSLRSRLMYGFKHFTLWQAWALLGVTLVLEPVSRSVFSLLRGGVQDLRNTLKAYVMLYRGLPDMLRRPQRNPTFTRGKP